MDLKSDTLLVADAFENFKKLFLEIHKLNSAKFLSAPGLARETTLLLTDIHMLLKVEKGIRGEICHAFLQYAKPNNKYMTNYDKHKESLYPKYWDVNSLYGWAMSQCYL